MVQKQYRYFLVFLITLLPILLVIFHIKNLIFGLKHEYSVEYNRSDIEKSYQQLDIKKSLFHKIPKTFHYIWISPFLNETNKSNIEVRVRENIQTCLDLHPNWNYTIWTDDLVRIEFPELIDLLIAAAVPPVISDVLRVNILARYGGIYLDTDFLCVRSFEPLLKQQYCTAFAGSEEAQQDNVLGEAVANALIGSTAGHFLLVRAAELILSVALGPQSPVIKTGPYFLAKMVRKFNSSSDCMYVYNKKLFYHCDFNQRKQCHSKLAEYKKDPDIYAIHLWYASWVVGLETLDH